MNLEEVLNFRRSVRRYDKNKPIDPEMGQASIWLYLAAYGMGTKAFGENGAGFLSMKSIIGYKRQGIPPYSVPTAI